MTDIAANSEYFVEAEVADHGAEIARTLVAEHRIVNARSIEPRYLDSSLAGATDGAGYLVLIYPAVPQGFRDRILSHYLGGPTPFSTAPGGAAAFIASSPPVIDADVPSTLVRDQTAQLPLAAFYDLRQMVVHQGSFFGVQVYYSGTSHSYVSHISFLREPLAYHQREEF